MSWASSLTDRPCVAWLAPSWLSSTTNGPLAVDTSHPPFSPSMKLLQGPNPQKRLRLRQHQQDDALLHDLTGRDLRRRLPGARPIALRYRRCSSRVYFVLPNPSHASRLSARTLNDEGIASPAGEIWGKTRVHAILRNEVYAGTLNCVDASGDLHALVPRFPIGLIPNFTSMTWATRSAVMC